MTACGSSGLRGGNRRSLRDVRGAGGIRELVCRCLESLSRRGRGSVSFIVASVAKAPVCPWNRSVPHAAGPTSSSWKRSAEACSFAASGFGP